MKRRVEVISKKIQRRFFLCSRTIAGDSLISHETALVSGIEGGKVVYEVESEALSAAKHIEQFINQT